MNKKILILGGGFAGVEAAIQLRKYDYEVCLVSNRDYLFVYPISIWIPVKKRKFDDVKINLDSLAKKHGFELIIDEVEKISSKDNLVILKDHQINYEYLVVAMGMGKLQKEGIEHTHSICGKPNESIVIIIQTSEKQICIQVDELLGQQQIVIKSLGKSLQNTIGISGGAIMGDGQVGLILDVDQLIKN